MPGQGKKIWGDGLQVSLACPGFHLEAQNFYRSRVGLDAALYAKKRNCGETSVLQIGPALPKESWHLLQQH
tara:strand:+ start:184 stop:396 length:213 start_codon:yes stop_codon:yes gene_type:complete